MFFVDFYADNIAAKRAELGPTAFIANRYILRLPGSHFEGIFIICL